MAPTPSSVLMGLTAGILDPSGIDPELVAEWVLPSGAAGAVVVAAWLVESKQRVIENMAPVLTMVFTPLFALMLAVAAVVYAVTGLGDAFDRKRTRNLLTKWAERQLLEPKGLNHKGEPTYRFGDAMDRLVSSLRRAG